MAFRNVAFHTTFCFWSITWRGGERAGWDGMERAAPDSPSSSLVAGSVLHEPQPSRVRKIGLIRSRQMVVMAKTATPGAVPNTDRNASAVPTTSNTFPGNAPASPLLSHLARTSPAKHALLQPSLRIMSSAEVNAMLVRVTGEVRSAEGWQSRVPGGPGVLSPGTRQRLTGSGLPKVLEAHCSW
ncbi:uncharacterized protein ACIBXB_016830 isoform 2-T2 [Morphnus guianensis]